MRLIDADALKEQFRTEDGAFVVGNSVRRLLAADDLIDDMPAIDAVPVVRCKDCKYNVANMTPDPLDSTDYEDVVCSYWMSDGACPTDFCSYGERRSDD